jgi:hypothetical protein
VFWVISVYFNIRNTLPKYGTFLLGHPVYILATVARALQMDLKEQIGDLLETSSCDFYSISV